MSARRETIPSKQTSTVFAIFPQGIQKEMATEVKNNITHRKSSEKVTSKRKIEPYSCTVALPQISEHDTINKHKPNNNLNGNLKFPQLSVSDEKVCTKDNNQIHGTLQLNLSSKHNYTVNIYDLYAKTNNKRDLNNTDGCNDKSEDKPISSIASKGLKEQPESFVSSNKSAERLKKWIHDSYTNRLLQLKAIDNRNNEMMISRNESRLVDSETNGISLLDSHRSFTNLSRGDSVIKPSRRSSIFVAPLENNSHRENKHSTTSSSRTFKFYGIVVKSLVGLLMRMQRLSISKTNQSAYSEFLYILAGPTTHAGQQGTGDEGQSLLFDKSWFSRTRAWSRMPTWAQSVMRLPPDSRTQQDVHHLKQLLSTMRSFRENVTEEVRTKLCQVIRYSRCDKGRVVFRQGHIGMDFYFIFTGSVLIQSDTYNEKTGQIETVVENILRAGEGFGEIALLGDGRRTASVICKEPTELCQIDKATFLNICQSLFNEQLQDRIDFARQFDIFHSWNNDDLKKLCFLSQVLDVPHSRIIEKNWANSKFAYFVMKGRASMLKEFDVTTVVEMNRLSLEARQGSIIELKVKGKQKGKQFAAVGTLQVGDCTDLAVLATDYRKTIPQITLISEGVRLFRVAVWTFLRLSPKVEMEEYMKKHQSRRFPTEEQLCAHYVTNLNWSEYKKNIVHTNRLEKSGSILASIPATLKGSSGWARWPGYAVIPKVGKSTRSIKAATEVKPSTSDDWMLNEISEINNPTATTEKTSKEVT